MIHNFYRLFMKALSLITWVPHKKLNYYLQHQSQVTQIKSFSGSPIWIHASSGELEYAKSVIREIRAKWAHVPILVTHTSLSSRPQLETLDVHLIGVLPLDEKKSVEKFIEKVKPRAFLVARTDLWPELVLQLKQKAIPSFLFSATFASGSGKTSQLASFFLKSTIQNLSRIFFVAQEDQILCEKIFGPVRGQVVGDTRFDQALYRLKNSPPIKLPIHPKIIVAGSTWAQDDEVLLEAAVRLKPQLWKWIWVPHEVSGPEFQNLKRKLTEKNLKVCLFSEVLHSTTWELIDVILVDKVGLLATLYPFARLSFIGGSFKKQVHSVMEALVAGSPVLVGPHHHNNREAIQFKTRGWVTEVPDAESFAQSCLRLESEGSKMSSEIQIEVNKRSGCTLQLLALLQADQPLIFH